MREDYKLIGTKARVDFEVEQDVAEKLRAMEKHTGLTTSELANTALKRFITQHSDFLPAVDMNRFTKKA